MTEEHTPYPSGIDSVDRARELEDWDHEKAKQLAEKDGIDLTDDHFKVLEYLRDYYIENGWPGKTHEMTQTLDDAFKSQGGKKYLHKLFPEGPLAQGTRIAGLPTPSHTQDKSFGSSQ